MNKKPLSGIKVLDIGQGVAAPYCGLLLAQYGAEVIKVEPINGDWARGVGAPESVQPKWSIRTSTTGLWITQRAILSA